ncbi:MAG: hypothetical protein ACYTG5_03915 [Planctomycetota bacterium]|jgi:hypothetical protein
MSLLLGLAICLAPQEPAASFTVTNLAPMDRLQVLALPMPVPRGRHYSLDAVELAGQTFPTQTLLRWSDGSVALTQAHLRVNVPAESTQQFELSLGGTLEQAAEWRQLPWLFPELPELQFELIDPWNRRFLAELVPDESAGRDGWLAGSELLRRRRFTSDFYLVEDPQQLLFTLRAYLSMYRGERRAELTVLLDNRCEGGLPLGPVRFKQLNLISRPGLGLRPRFIKENLLEPPRMMRDGSFKQVLLGPSAQLYLGDRTAKSFRFDLFAEDAELEEELAMLARWQVRQPLVAVPDLDWVRFSGAFGMHGGPAPVFPGEQGRAGVQLQSWRLAADFGPFGGFGDPRDAAAQGTARNGPAALHNVLRWSSGDLLMVAEGMALQQSLRPPPGMLPRLPESMSAWRQGLSRRSIERPHGFTPLDYEHFSVDLLYDYYWLTGDPYALDELARIGKGLSPLLAGLPFMTSRGEGWCLQAGVQIARATGDRELIASLYRRFEEVILPELGRHPDCYAIRQPAHADALGEGESFDLPWQMAALIYGLHALFQETGSEDLRDAIVSVALIMAGPGWLEGVGPKYLLSSSNPDRYQMPVGYEALEGTAWMQIGAFELAAELAAGEADRSLLRARADALWEPQNDVGQEPEGLSASSQAAANTWFQIYLDRRPVQR